MTKFWRTSFVYFAWQTLRYGDPAVPRSRMWSYWPRWRRALKAGANSVRDEQAWLTFAAIDFLDSWLKPQHRVFEYGGGGSTLFFCRRAGFVATVEHDGVWFARLTDIISEKGYEHWEGFHEPGTLAPENARRSKENPADFASGDSLSRALSFEQYAKTIHRYPPEYFDLVLVDGRARPACIAESMNHLRPGGLLVVDNSDRPYYLAAFTDRLSKEFIRRLHGHAPTPYVPAFTATTIFEKK